MYFHGILDFERSENVLICFFFLLFSINTILDRTIYLVQNLTETVQYKQVILPNFLFFFILRKSGITLRFFFVLTYFCNLHFPLEFTTCFVPRIVVINSNNLVFAKSHTISLSRLFENIISTQQLVIVLCGKLSDYII